MSKIFLNRNEYFFSHPPEVIQALTSMYAENFISHYAPPSELETLKSALSKVYGVEKELILLGHGAEDIFVKVLSWFRKEVDSILIEDFSWTNYLHIAEGFQYQVVAAPTLKTKNSFAFNKKAFFEKLSQLKSAIVFVTSPNNPTGHLVNLNEFYDLVTVFPQHIFILDSVYNEIIDHNYSQLFSLHNFIFVGSFSKFFGMPGLRLGYAIGRLPKAFQLNLGLQPSAISAALAALNNIHFYQANRDFMLNFSNTLLDKKFDHLEIYKSFAPFFLAKVTLPALDNLGEQPLLAHFKQAEDKSGVVPKYLSRSENHYIRFGLGPQPICEKIEIYLKGLGFGEFF